MRTSTWLTAFTLTAISTLPAYASHGSVSGSSSSGSSGSSGSSNSSSSSSHSSSSSSSSSSSGGSSSHSSSSSSSPASSSHGSGGHGGGSSGGSWGGYGGTVRDHRSGGGGGGGSGRSISHGTGDGGITLGGGHGGSDPTVRDHRTHTTVVDGATVVEDGGSDSGEGGDDCCSTYDAVGYRNEPYGAWGHASGAPQLALELGTGMRRFADPLPAAIGGRGGSASAVSTQLRFLVHMSGPLYIGAEGEIGGLVTGAAASTDPSIPTSAMMFGGAGVIGAMSRRGNAAFGVELAGGGRSVVYQFQTAGDMSSTSMGTAVFEPRARAQYWVTPFVALGAQAGANLVNRGDWMAGAFLSIHTRAFGNND